MKNVTEGKEIKSKSKNMPVKTTTPVFNA